MKYRTSKWMDLMPTVGAYVAFPTSYSIELCSDFATSFTGYFHTKTSFKNCFEASIIVGVIAVELGDGVNIF